MTLEEWVAEWKLEGLESDIQLHLMAFIENPAYHPTLFTIKSIMTSIREHMHRKMMGCGDGT
ncbi:hypothetical protein LCGC14_1169980 [marine sediment metagenome]|uniref:Uncharacterized protein n=1 Tax=marine sediment metagenome TaxID=412755 RepID=A0A0F9LQ73_9ZZZZ